MANSNVTSNTPAPAQEPARFRLMPLRATDDAADEYIDQSSKGSSRRVRGFPYTGNSLEDALFALGWLKQHMLNKYGEDSWVVNHSTDFRPEPAIAYYDDMLKVAADMIRAAQAEVKENSLES